jgi:2'-5' RNA ligase
VARLFVAVWPPDDVAVELGTLHRKDQRGVRFVPPENWHITMRFLGEAAIDEVVGALDRTALPPARARLGPADDIVAERALVVPVSGVDDLAKVVTASTRELGKRPPKRFTGHLTLARVKSHAPMPPVLGALVSAEFDVEEIALVQSRLHPEGARYETLHTWPLGSPA